METKKRLLSGAFPPCESMARSVISTHEQVEMYYKDVERVKLFNPINLCGNQVDLFERLGAFGCKPHGNGGDFRVIACHYFGR